MTKSSKIFQKAFDTAASSVKMNSETFSDINKYKNMVEELEGGLADNMSLGDIAVKHDVDVKKLTKQFLMGINIEMEHTDDKEKASEIAMDHLVEDPEYYTNLQKIEVGDDSKYKKSAKRQFAKDLQKDKDFEEFKKNAKYKVSNTEFSFGTPNVTSEDPYIMKKKYSRVGKKENKEATGSGSSGAYSAPLFGGDDEFLKKSDEETPHKVEATEATGSGSVGAYETPAAWAKSTNKKDFRGASKPLYKGGSFVSVKKKCTKFPYCNAGDINALHMYKNESLQEAIKNVSKKMNISENTIKAILEYEYEKLNHKDIYK